MAIIEEAYEDYLKVYDLGLHMRVGENYTLILDFYHVILFAFQ